MCLIKCLLPIILVLLVTIPLSAAPLLNEGTVTTTTSFNNNYLTIPSVDTADQVGRYQNVTFELTDQGTWLLLDASESLGRTIIEGVRVVTTDSFPVQVFLQVNGQLIGCGGLGAINQRRTDEQLFEVLINEAPVANPGEMTCTADLKPFETYIDLDVYGLDAGFYSYHVRGQNMSGEFGTFTGTFELTEDNSLEAISN